MKIHCLGTLDGRTVPKIRTGIFGHGRKLDSSPDHVDFQMALHIDSPFLVDFWLELFDEKEYLRIALTVCT